MLRLSREKARRPGIAVGRRVADAHAPEDHVSQQPVTANSNTPPNPYAAWAAWASLTTAGIDSCLAFQRAWLDASQALIRRQRESLLVAQTDHNSPSDVLLAATVDDLRECGEAVVKAQVDILESWRHTA